MKCGSYWNNKTGNKNILGGEAPPFFKTRKDCIDAHEQILSFTKDPLAFCGMQVV